MRALFFVAVLGASAGCKHDEPREPAASSAPAEETPQPRPEGEVAVGRMLLPPSQAGASKFVVEGCAAKPSEEPATRGVVTERPDHVDASALGTGIVVGHDLFHACCLKAESQTTVDGDRVTISETLSGQPCRCRCSSVQSWPPHSVGQLMAAQRPSFSFRCQALRRSIDRRSPP